MMITLAVDNGRQGKVDQLGLECVVGVTLTMNFNGGWGNQGDFGAFGDFLGGVLNPILGFATVGLLIWSLKMQMKELSHSNEQLALTRQELKETKEETMLSRKAMEAQVEHLQKESQLNELRQILAIQMGFIDKCLSTKVFGKYVSFNSKTNYIDINILDLLNEDANITKDEYINLQRNTSPSYQNPISKNIEELKQHILQYSILALEYERTSNEKIYAYPYLTKAITLIYNLTKFSESKELDILKAHMSEALKSNNVVDEPNTLA
ncbi:hypothetical protein [Shewanella baltica]|uniref:hypothetical protein n=1 Tax=Shewanella baltica TaxID=62322 RepID=UPI003D79D981